MSMSRARTLSPIPAGAAKRVPADHAGVWIDIDGERWLNTGDLGRRDANGYFWLTGARKS